MTINDFRCFMAGTPLTAKRLCLKLLLQRLPSHIGHSWPFRIITSRAQKFPQLAYRKLSQKSFLKFV